MLPQKNLVSKKNFIRRTVAFTSCPFTFCYKEQKLLELSLITLLLLRYSGQLDPITYRIAGRAPPTSTLVTRPCVNASGPSARGHHLGTRTAANGREERSADSSLRPEPSQDGKEKEVKKEKRQQNQPLLTIPIRIRRRIRRNKRIAAILYFLRQGSVSRVPSLTAG